MDPTPLTQTNTAKPKPYRNVRQRARAGEAIRNAAYRCGGTHHPVTAQMVLDEIPEQSRNVLDINIRTVRTALGYAYWAVPNGYVAHPGEKKRIERTYRLMP